MANYLGYGLMAGVEGFKSGFGMAQQKQEMEWQKKQRKKLEEKELKIQEGASMYSNLVAQVYADGVLSEDESMKLNTAFLAAGYEVQAVIKDTHTAIQAMDKNKLEQDFAWLEMFAEITEGLDPKDVQGAFDIIKLNVKSEKGINLFDAYGSLQKKRYEVAQKEKPWEKAAILPSEMRAPYLEQEGIEIPEIAPTVKEPTFNEKRFNWKIEQYNQGRITLNQLLESEGIAMSPEKATGLEKTIQDIITQGTKAGISQKEINTAVKNKILGKPTPEPEPKPETVSTLKNWEAMFDVNAEEGPRTEEEYNRVLELLAQSKDEYKPKYPTWKEALVAEVKGIGRELEGITDRTDRKFLLDIYKQKLEEIKAKYPDVDLTQFSQPKELSGWDKFMEGIGF